MKNEDWEFINEMIDVMIQMKKLLESLAERIENLEKKNEPQ